MTLLRQNAIYGDMNDETDIDGLNAKGIQNGDILFLFGFILLIGMITGNGTFSFLQYQRF